MKPIHFPEVNHTYAKDQPQYQPIPGYREVSEEGPFIFCHKLTWRERFKIFYTGKLWVSFLTFNRPLTPSYHSVHKSDVLKSETDTGWVEEIIGHVIFLIFISSMIYALFKYVL